MSSHALIGIILDRTRTSCFMTAAALMTLLFLSSDAAAVDEPQRYALLVGVTEYDHLSQSYWLDGPENDALLLRDLLIERFAVPTEQIALLTHSLGLENADLQPTRGNIEREFRRLADIARLNPQATFVICLAGHGSQQPNTGDDVETDGYDEIFLPQDVAGWGGTTAAPTIQNAITDDELADWLGDITDTGAFVCVVIDACHSGTMTRSVERSRAVPLQALASSTAWEGVAVSSADPPRPLSSRGSELPATLLDGEDDSPRLVAIYAAQSTEPTVERLMPYGRYDISDRRVHGLLTFTINEVLRNANGSLSYRELMEAVQASYDRWGRRGPTPAIEGPLDRVVFDTTAVARSSIRLQNDPAAPLSINQGGVQGLTTGSVLAVFPPTGEEQSDDPLGHVTVTECRTLDASVEPTTFAGGILADQTSLPDGARCEIVLLHYDDQLRTSVAVDCLDSSGAAVPADVVARLEAKMHELSDEPGSWIRFATMHDDPEWVLNWNDDELRVVSAFVADQVDDVESTPAIVFGPHADDASAEAWLASVLHRIVHVRNLRRIAALEGGEGLAGVPFEFDVTCGHDESTGGAATRPRLGPGQMLTIEMSNPNDYPIDVTLLYIDATYGVTSLFPMRSENNRLQPGDRHSIRVRLTAEPIGVESFLAIAVRGQGQSVAFNMLTQPSIADIAAVSSMSRDAQRVFQSPLGALLRNATYQSVRGEGVTPPGESDYAMRLYTWEVLNIAEVEGR